MTSRKIGNQDICSWKRQWTFDNPLRALIHPPAKVLGAWVRSGMTVVDAGCGIGHFSLGMAELVGPQGRVVSIDLQQGALDKLMQRAARAGLDRVITPQACTKTNLGPLPRADFALAFWMIHETPDVKDFFSQLAASLNHGGRVLVAEPPFHVRKNDFEEEIRQAKAAGLRLEARPRVPYSRAALFVRS